MMRSRRPVRRRTAFTMIELAIVLGVIAILAAIAIPYIPFARMKMDSSAGTVQNNIIASQSQTVQHNYPYLLTFCYSTGQYRIVGDKNASGTFDTGETINWRALPEGTQFVIPPTTIDGAAPYYATGPGLTYSTDSGCGASAPTLTLFPNGSSSGEMVVYLGSGNSERLSDNRALQIYASTSKVYLWRMMSDGTWKKNAQ